jgi:hypothetical protein
LKFELKVSKNKTFWNQTLESSLSFIESMLGIISATVTSCLFFSNLKIKDSSNFFLKKLLFHELFFNSKCTKTFSIEVHTQKKYQIQTIDLEYRFCFRFWDWVIFLPLIIVMLWFVWFTFKLTGSYFVSFPHFSFVVLLPV